MQNMKKPLFILLLIVFQFTQSQNSFELTIIEKSDVPTTEKIHYYLIQLDNHSNQIQNYTLDSKVTDCKNKNHVQHSKRNFEFYDASKTRPLDKIIARSEQSTKFYVKTIVPQNTKRSTWNCTTITVQNKTSNQTQSINMVSYYQDPKKAN
jgi:hypothetical protein